MKELRFAVVLAGCGAKDGSEIHEAVHLLTAISRRGADYQCFAPDVEQHHVIDHLTGEEMPDRRSVLREAARIARGAVRPLSEYGAEEYDGLMLPGGYGAAKNLCTYALAGADFTVNGDVERALRATHAQGKPIAALCIAPMIVARVLPGVTLTLGPAGGASDDAARLGAHVEPAGLHGVVCDEVNRVYTTPCYMHEASIADVAEGIDALVEQVVASLRAR